MLMRRISTSIFLVVHLLLHGHTSEFCVGLPNPSIVLLACGISGLGAGSILLMLPLSVAAWRESELALRMAPVRWKSLFLAIVVGVSSGVVLTRAVVRWDIAEERCLVPIKDWLSIVTTSSPALYGIPSITHLESKS